MSNKIYFKSNGDIFKFFTDLNCVKLVPDESFVEKTHDATVKLEHIDVNLFVDQLIIENEKVQDLESQKIMSTLNHSANNQFTILLGTIRILEKVLAKEELNRSEMVHKNLKDLQGAVDKLRGLISDASKEVNNL